MNLVTIQNTSKSLVLFALCLGLYLNSFAQTPSVDTAQIANINRKVQFDSDSVYVVADPAFIKVPTKRWLLGDHYRREWITPVRVPVVRLDTLHGGMTIKKEGGGKQTKSLQLAAKDEKEYAIRTVEKFPERALPPELAGTVAADFVKDQISSANPYAPLVVAHLAKAAQIYHSNPQFVFVKSSPALGEYDTAFGNQFYLMEERPQGNWEGTPLFGNADKIFGTDKMMEALRKSRHKVDSRSFLRARLFDILIGDWDRHEDQWTWATIKTDSMNLMYPIPKDRDQAFAKLDGVIPWIGTRKWALRRAQYFKKEIKDLKGLVWSGRNIDRLLLVDITWPEWAEEASTLQNLISDAVIAQSIAQLPAAIAALSGKEIGQKLIKRRNELLKYAQHYYRILTKEVEWTGTDNKDRFIISRASDSSFAVKHYAFDKEDFILKKEKTFLSEETKELRLYGLAGDDAFEVDSSVRTKTKIRFIGGHGSNSYTGTADKKLAHIYAYDTALKGNNEVRKLFKVRYRRDTLTQRYIYGDYTYNVLAPLILPGFNPDDGLYLGGGINYKKYKWGKPGIAVQHRLGANYAFNTGAYNFVYEGFFGRAIGRWNLLTNLYLNQPDYVLNFYGLGNNTDLIKKDRIYNRVRVEQFIAQAGLQRFLGIKHSLSLMGEFLSTKVQNSDSRFVSVTNPALDSSDFKRVHWAGATASYIFSTRNNTFFPTKGVALETAVRHLYSPSRSNSFTNYSAAFSWYVSLGKIVWASRVGGATLNGQPQFFQYNQLSGLTNLRGYRRSRFSGESMVYNNNELRIPIANLNGYLLRGKFGLTLFSDNGRVWIDNEDSDKWHAGYGGGIWIVPFQRISFTANYGMSAEDKVLYVKAGFLF